MRHITVRDVIDRAGGYVELSYQLNITNFALRSWTQRGIPRRYWKLLAKKTGLTQEQIENARLAVTKKAS
jgi:hypothetical protein